MFYNRFKNGAAPILTQPRALVSVLRRDARCLFLVAVAVTAHEFVDAAGCIDKFLLAGEEGVR